MKKHINLLLFLSLLMSTFVHAEHWPTGYYRSKFDGPDYSYYYNDEYRWYCHVQNVTQANLYNVESQVRIVGDAFEFLDAAVCLNDCPWPNGFYKVAGTDSPVFRLYAGNICTITSDEMLAAYGGTNAVIQAEDTSDFSAQRTQIGQCFWPSWDLVAK